MTRSAGQLRNQRADLIEAESSSEQSENDCLDEDNQYQQEGLDTPFSTTFQTAKLRKLINSRQNITSGTTQNLTCDDSMVNTYKNIDEKQVTQQHI